MGASSVFRAFVRNDAMRSDPQEIYGWRVFAIVASACFGGMIFGWETGAIGGVLALDPFATKFNYIHMSKTAKSNQQQNIVSILQAGCFAACFITWWPADRFGRKRSLQAAGLVTIIGVIFQAASAIKGQLSIMYVGRFITGLGVGSASALTPMYIAECAPRAIRGALIASYQLFIVLGILISFWINYGCNEHVAAPAIYIVPLVLQATPAFLLVICMLFCPESPRWLASKDHWERATAILIQIRGLPADSDYVRNELQDIANQLDMERRLTGDASWKVLWKEMLTIPGNRKRLIISVILMMFQQMTGTNAINYYAPQIFANLGMNTTTSGLFATGVYGIVKTVAVLTFIMFVADSLGRRRSLLWTSAAQGTVMFVVGIYGRVQPPVKGADVTPFGYVAIACIFAFAALFQFGWGPACWIIVSEIPTARLRATNVAIAAGTQWLFNFVVARSVLTMQVTMGTAGYGMFFLFGSLCFIMGIFVFFFVPETKGVSLEMMDGIFGVMEPVKNIDEEADSKSVHAIDEGQAYNKS